MNAKTSRFRVDQVEASGRRPISFGGGGSRLPDKGHGFVIDALPSDGEFTTVRVDEVELDFEQPRKLRDIQLTKSMLENPPETLAQEYLQEIADIRAMAATFREIGQKDAVTVYRNEKGRLVMVDGERRYWAAVLVGLESLKCVILRERPQLLRRFQFVANHQQKPLRLKERLSNLDLALKEASLAGIKVEDAQALSAFAGLGQRTAYRYLAVLDAPDDVQAMIEDGRLNNLDLAATLVALPDENARRQRYEAESGAAASPEEAGEGGKPGQETAPAAPSRSKKAKKGRPLTKLSLGSLDARVAKLVLTRVLPEGIKREIDWDSLESMQTAWKKYVQSLTAKEGK